MQLNPSQPIRHRGDRPAMTRQDTSKLSQQSAAQAALIIGIVFSVLFTLLIAVTGPSLDRFVKLPDQGADWYYWKLPQVEDMARLTSWGLYLAHQIALWGVIWYAQARVKKYTAGLHKVNLLALGINALFVVLHYVQTHIWYDGLAQDTPVWSSQWSVIILLIWIILMENNRRGVFFGKKLPIRQAIIDFARKYHGYYFAWAIIYTFWFHPMEYSAGHLLGFFYTFLLLLQSSLFLSRIHVNKWWMFVQEIVVLAHGTIVAVVSGGTIWSMFFFGFFGVFVITQMHGLGLKRWMKFGMYGFYVVAALVVYSGKGFNRLWELAAIPLVDYLALGVMVLVFGGGIAIYNRFFKREQPVITSGTQVSPAGTD
jgi:hypothetical protein